MNDAASAHDALLQADRRHLIHPLHFPQDHADARLIVSGQGAILTADDGREYIDGLAGLWNVHVGHGRKELADAAAVQMAKLGYASAYAGFTNEPAIRLAERIVELAYPNMVAAYFTTAGAESNESAFKFARYYWKRRGKPDKVKVISRHYAYHGVTLATLSATSLPGYAKMFGPMVPEFLQVPPPFPYRWPGNGDCGIEAADAVEAAIEANGADSIAAVIAEPIQGAGGVIVPPDNYWPRLRAICDRHDVLLIADEVITGFGRTGHWFALDMWGVQPDMLTFAKGVTSGYVPLGGVVVNQRVHEALEDAPAEEKFMHAGTYSGHPVCCAVALRNIAIIEREDLVQRAADVGKVFRDKLATLASLPAVGEVRGAGLIAGIELVLDKATRQPMLGQAARISRELQQRGLITRVRGGGHTPVSGDTICLCPPLMTPEPVLDRIVQIVGEEIQTLG